MNRVIALSLIAAGGLYAQSAQCLQNPTGPWVPCSLAPTVQLAQSANTKVSAGAGTTITNAFGSNTTAGNTILCLGFESAAAIPVVTDAQSNTYVVKKSSATAPGYTIAVAQNITGGTTDTITLTTTSGAASFACYELRGAVNVGDPTDLFDAQQGTAGSIPFTPTVTMTPNELVFAAAGLGGGTVNATPALGNSVTGFTTVDASNTAVTGGAALSIFYAAHATVQNPTAFTQSLSLNASQTFSGSLVSVRPAMLGVFPAPSNPSYTAAGASTNSTLVKSEPGQITSITLTNTTTTDYYLRLYNSATAPTCSSATGFVETIPAFGASANGGGIQRTLSSPAGAFTNGIGFCITGGAGSTDNTNAAVGVFVTIFFQ